MSLSLFPVRSYDSEPDYIDEFGNEVRINRNRSNERQVGRFTIVDEISPDVQPSLLTSRSYHSEPDYIDKFGNEVRINRNRSNERQVGRFTIVDEISPERKPKKTKKRSKKNKPKSLSPKQLKVGQQIGRFTVKYINPPSKIKLGELKLATSRSPRNSTSPRYRVGRFTIKKK
jgi:hypothetical protein